LAKLLRYPDVFEGDSADIFISAFGMQTQVDSNDPAFDGVTKRKLGAMVSYSFLPWLAATARYDRVEPNTSDSSQTFSVVSPALIFRTGWQARDQIALQYSHWFYGKNSDVRTQGFPYVYDHSIVPDKDMISLTATFSW
jgi:hypothetical protein